MLEHVIVRQPLSEVKQLSMKELMPFRDSVRNHVFLNRVVSNPDQFSHKLDTNNITCL